MALREKRSTTINANGSTVSRSTTSSPRPSPTATRSSSPAAPTRSSTTAAGSTGNAPASGGASGATDLKSVPLVVLNNTTTPNLARDAAQRFRAGGWTVTSTGNLTNDIISTCAYYDPNVANAKAAARALRTQFPTIKRVEPKFAELPAGPVVVVLTPDYSTS